LYGKRQGWGRHDGDGRLPFLVALRHAAWALLMPVIILGGIYGGVFTPTEASVVAVFYALFVGVVVYREVRPQAVFEVLKATLGSPELFLLGVNAALFVIGMFIETSASIIVLAPILAPVAAHFGIDPVHFGIVMVVNLALGMITPPFGVNLFAACAVARVSLDQIVARLLPFVGVVLCALLVVTYFPPLTLFLRDLVYR
jgi:TRAP-type C4-dicarboxylate transport system permease large subunit